ncbi:DUF2911 domain-containing protein [Flavivirga aquimarina]|uniref:DUF2911 domain-containing protein n=1 Tax=Flavivirga aquimarina TaxID=2027862 RepID=A0ABT8W532_9FLAO|nr:DUF2911 domain-containing protein [Flavivirga aquimarina]MDO5968219.1 DUF2911 domain-containing protein [Flavivirga aquimarina]
MKKLLLIGLILTFSLNVSAQIKTPAPSPFSKMEQKVGLTDVTIEYSRPGVKGRTIFGDLVPYGKSWRTGANARTKITFSTEVTIDGQTLKAGSYSIFTVPNKDNWEVVFYNDGKKSGTPKEFDEKFVAAKTTADVFKLPVKIETFTITLDDLSNSNATLGMMWEDVYVGVKFEVPTDEAVIANIKKVMSGPSSGDYYSAAVYYLREGKDINEAKIWIDKAIDMTKNKAPFWMLRQQSLIYAKAGDKKGAIKAAKKSLAGAEKEENENYIKMNKDSLKEWGAI